MKNIFYAVIAICLLSLLSGVGNFTFAQTGDIRGHVEDAESGEGLPGVNVVVVGTEMGAATDQNGDFVIINVDPGTYDVQASMIGYANVTKTEVLVTIDQIATVNFALETSAIRGEEVVVQADRGVIHAEVSNSQLVSTSEQIIETAGVRSMSEYLANQPGVSDPQDLSIRGGDSHETGMIVNGLTLVDERAGQPQS
ncbi:MAG TPA: carboxypeptidase-like regulatory domain-containing protein, partial [bacterium]|nr:carboxypeptidase-like regulatory domain-containing protein [bacterium]